jgi:hypothetical protein
VDQHVCSRRMTVNSAGRSSADKPFFAQVAVGQWNQKASQHAGAVLSDP